MNRWKGKVTPVLLAVGLALNAAAADNPAPDKALTLDECVGIALKQNPAVLKARQELERTQGLIIESRSGNMPRVSAVSQYALSDQSSSQDASSTPAAMQESQGYSSGIGPYQKTPWLAQVEVSQSLYAGGRINSDIRSARFTDAMAQSRLRRSHSSTC